MDSRVTKIAGLLCLLTFAFAQESTKPEVPDKIKTPASQELALVAHATGFQFTLVSGVPMANLPGCSKRLRLNFEITQAGSLGGTTPVLPGSTMMGAKSQGKYWPRWTRLTPMQFPGCS